MINSFFFFDITFWFYLIGTALYFGLIIIRKREIGQLATIITIGGWISNTLGLVLRTLEAKHAPFANLYESLLFFSWMIVFIYLMLEFRYRLKVMGAFVVAVGFLATWTAIKILPYMYQAVSPLNPALQSIWLEIHVFTTFIGYATFGIAFGINIMYLLKKFSEKRKNPGYLFLVFPESEALDDLSYRSILLGVPFLTIGVITGAIWANYAWGTYWGWDPKETWSLITWFIYLGYLHSRYMWGWRGTRAAYFSIIGFGAVVFTYFGVSFLLPGLHAYSK